MSRKSPTELVCSGCGDENPAGFVWCRSCKAILTRSPTSGRSSRAWRLVVVAVGAVVLGLGVKAIVSSVGPPSDAPAPVAVRNDAQPPREVEKRLDAWWEKTSGGRVAPSDE